MLTSAVVYTQDGEQAEPEDPPLWKTVLWARSGFNATVKHQPPLTDLSIDGSKAP